MATDPRQSQAQAAQRAELALIALWAAGQAQLLARLTKVIAHIPPTALGWRHALPQLRAAIRPVQAHLSAATPPLLDVLFPAIASEATAAADAAVASALSSGRGGGAAVAHPPAAAAPVPPHTPWHAHHTPSPPPPTIPPPPTGNGLERGGEEYFNLSEGHGARSDRFIRQELEGSFTAQLQRITRLPDDIYREVGAKGARAAVLDNGATLRQAQAAAWVAFGRTGVTGFTDKAGRRWSISQYTEMAVRTAAARAFNESHLARMKALGVQYFTVPEHATSCPLCTPWQGAVLTDGPAPDASVRVDGTLRDAIIAGLFHPQCRHALLPYFPQSMPRPERTAWTPERERQWRDVQRQRSLELAVRRAREALALATTPQQQAHLKRVIAVARARLREHLHGKPYLSRQYEREQPHLGYGSVKLPQGSAAVGAGLPA